MHMGGYGGKHRQLHRPEGALDGAYYDPRAYVRNMLAMLSAARAELGDEIELLHDIHERLHPIDAMAFAKAVEPLNLFFLEDALAPEDLDWFERIRQQTTTRLAMGELFVHPTEWRMLVERRLIDFIRMHISAIGGITPARNAAILAGASGYEPRGMARQTSRRSVMRLTCTSTCGRQTLVFRSGVASLSWFMRSSPARPKCETASCIPMISPASESISTKSWPRNIRVPMRLSCGLKRACRMARQSVHDLAARSSIPRLSARRWAQRYSHRPPAF